MLTYQGGLDFQKQQLKALATQSDGSNAQQMVIVSGTLTGVDSASIAFPVSVTGTVTTAQGAAATGGYSYNHIGAGQATTVVKASAGTLHSLALNSAATATNVTTVYDSTSGAGTVIAIPNVVAATVPTTLIFDLAFTNGLTIVTATANGGDMTVNYK